MSDEKDSTDDGIKMNTLHLSAAKGEKETWQGTSTWSTRNLFTQWIKQFRTDVYVLMVNASLSTLLLRNLALARKMLASAGLCRSFLGLFWMPALQPHFWCLSWCRLVSSVQYGNLQRPCWLTKLKQDVSLVSPLYVKPPLNRKTNNNPTKLPRLLRLCAQSSYHPTCPQGIRCPPHCKKMVRWSWWVCWGTAVTLLCGKYGVKITGKTLTAVSQTA